jgi:hypothetical protein
LEIRIGKAWKKSLLAFVRIIIVHFFPQLLCLLFFTPSIPPPIPGGEKDFFTYLYHIICVIRVLYKTKKDEVETKSELLTAFLTALTRALIHPLSFL